MRERIVMIDPGCGNLRSLAKALELLTGRGIPISADPDMIRKADRLLLPGDGSFRAAMAGIAPVREALDEAVLDCGKPCLGICVGMQIMVQTSEENGVHAGLGWLHGSIRSLAGDGPLPKSPFSPDGRHRQKRIHLGWTEMQSVRAHAVVPDGSETMYFIHGYGMDIDGEVGTKTQIIARSHHLRPFVAITGCNNILGVQFHPEKSQRAGLALLERFLAWRP